MSKTTEFTLGGKPYSIPPLNLKKLRLAWPVISRVMKAPPPISFGGLTKAVEAMEAGNSVAESLVDEAAADNDGGFSSMMEYTFDRTRAAIELFIIGMGGDPRSGEADALEASLDYDEAQKIPGLAMELLTNSGFLKPVEPGSTEGNALTTNPAGNPSTGTSTG